MPGLLRRLAVVPLMSSVLLAAGCAAPADESAAPADALVVYNAQHEQLTEEWVGAFTDKTGIEVELRNGGDAELSNQLVAEGQASPADVFLTENSPAMSLVERNGLLATVDDQTLASVPEQYRPASGMWTGIAARSTVLVYNPDEISVDELPASLMDLAKPEWKGRWGGAPSGADFQAIVSAVLATQGSEATGAWLEGMKANAEIYSNNIATMKAVNAGDVPVGVIYHYYWYRDQDGTKENSQHTRLHYFGAEDPGAFVSISGGGVLASSTRKDAAQKFLSFLTSEEGQRILGEGYSFEYPLVASVPPKPPLPALDSLDAPIVEPSILNGSEVIELMTQAGLL